MFLPMVKDQAARNIINTVINLARFIAMRDMISDGISRLYPQYAKHFDFPKVYQESE